MNPLFIGMLTNKLRQIANTPNITSIPFDANEASKIREDILSAAKSAEKDESQVSSQLIRTKDFLFYTNQFGQAMLNPFALGEVIFGLDYLAAKPQSPADRLNRESEMWSYIHPLIQKSSKSLYQSGHYANAAEDAFIEINDRAKSIFKKLVPTATIIPDGVDLMHKLFKDKPPLCPVCDLSTESGENVQKGFHFMAAGAMSALRNPKAHSNDEVIDKKESMRRLMFASLLMYKLDEGGL